MHGNLRYRPPDFLYPYSRTLRHPTRYVEHTFTVETFVPYGKSTLSRRTEVVLQLYR